MTKLLSKYDRIILDELCKNSQEYIRIDVTKLARNTGLARNTISKGIEKLKNQSILKTLFTENLEIQNYDRILIILSPKFDMSREEYAALEKFLCEREEVESVINLVTTQKSLFSIAIILSWKPTYRIFGKVHMRERLSASPLQMISKLLYDILPEKVEELQAYYILNTPKLLFNYRFSLYNPVTGSKKP